jgi:hypothetical protein
MIYRLVREVREELLEKLIIIKISINREVDIKQVLPIYWDRIIDQPSETRVRWLFLDNKRN